MNYLAHAYLSFQQPDILAGNMISDFVKGKKQFDYPITIQHGITLHRLIDTFTDTHPATKKANSVFKPFVGAYAGAFTDIVYDHFLALDTNEQTEKQWKAFARATYTCLQSNSQLLPERFARMLPFMQSQDWLFNYRHHWGIANSFEGLVRRAKYLDSSTAAFTAFENGYAFLQNCFADFFPEVKAYAFEQFNRLLSAE